MNPYLDLEDFNSGIVTWGRATAQATRMQMLRLGIRQGPVSKTFRSGYGKDRGGEINRVSFIMARPLIFVHKGVGRGWPISRAGSALARGRVAKEFFNPVIDERITALADFIAESHADAIVKNIGIR